jgi:amidohydrolase
MTIPPDIRSDVDAVGPGIVALRRALHQHPELAFTEVWTAATLAARMRGLGLVVQDGIGGTGVLAMLDGARAGRTLLLRADIDGLPMEETTGREYASKLPNRNHACGHDAHAAIVVGVADVLRRYRERIAGRCAFVFQPADEPMRGALRMIEDGLLERVRPDMSLSLHVLPLANTGQVVVQSGPIWASWDTRILTINGPPPSPDGRVKFDLARVAAQVTIALYEMVEREGRSREPVSFRVRALNAEQRGAGAPSQAAIEVLMGRGERSEATIEVNLALYDNALRTRLLHQIEHVAETVVDAAGGALRWGTDYALPALVNDEHVTRAVERAAHRVIGQANVIKNWRNRFSDDFGLFMAAAPGCLMLLGTANPDKGLTESWHRPGFDIDEDALPVGVEILARAALELLQ